MRDATPCDKSLPTVRFGLFRTEEGLPAEKRFVCTEVHASARIVSPRLSTSHGRRRESSCAPLISRVGVGNRAPRSRRPHSSCHIFKAGPLDAILVIFGRRALGFFFCLKALGKK